MGNTADATKKLAPSAAPIPSDIPCALALCNAAICVKTSGAPLPNDSKVAPATSSGSASHPATFDSAGQKKCSATFASTEQSSTTRIACVRCERG